MGECFSQSVSQSVTRSLTHAHTRARTHALIRSFVHSRIHSVSKGRIDSVRGGLRLGHCGATLGPDIVRQFYYNSTISDCKGHLFDFLVQQVWF